MKIKEININDIIPYARNPRKNSAVDKVAASIKEFGFRQPIVIDAGMVVIVGHTRLAAAQKLGLETVPVHVAEGLTPAQIKAYRIADNRTNDDAEWDMDLLKIELEELTIDGFDLSLTGFDEKEIELAVTNYKANGALAECYGEPPFSVLDTTSKRWLDRRKSWESVGLLHDAAGRADKLLDLGAIPSKIASTSVFDPVLAEIVYGWFAPPRGLILDPFCGGPPRSFVAASLGYSYIGFELRQEQVDHNYEVLSSCGLKGVNIKCDDAQNINKYIGPAKADFIFSCPPYADLEKYSDDPRDLSSMRYPEFIAAYRSIVDKACKALKMDSFAVFVVSEVRDKKGGFYNFVGDTISAFVDAGMVYYNEIILLNAVGTGAFRAKKTFDSGRKVIRRHQNILVFVKGDAKRAADRAKESRGVIYDSDE